MIFKYRDADGVDHVLGPFDGDSPAMIVFTQREAEQVRNMATKATRYLLYPTMLMSADEAAEWMREGLPPLPADPTE
jgi:hypothetical protein